MLRNLMEAVYLDSTMDASLAAVKELLSTPGIDVVTVINLETKNTDAIQPAYTLIKPEFYGAILSFYDEPVQVTPLLLAMLCNNSAVFTYLLEQGAVLRPEYLSVYLRYQVLPDPIITKATIEHPNITLDVLMANTRVIPIPADGSVFPFHWSIRYADHASYRCCSLFTIEDRESMRATDHRDIFASISAKGMPNDTVLAASNGPVEQLTLGELREGIQTEVEAEQQALEDALAEYDEEVAEEEAAAAASDTDTDESVVSQALAPTVSLRFGRDSSDSDEDEEANADLGRRVRRRRA